jgi:hypothetical protein
MKWITSRRQGTFLFLYFLGFFNFRFSFFSLLFNEEKKKEEKLKEKNRNKSLSIPKKKEGVLLRVSTTGKVWV